MPILQWLDRDNSIKKAQQVQYCLLNKQEEFGDNTDNMIIQGDNLNTLKSLLPYYAGKVKCIYIDPPYNTKSAFEQYDDNLEHSKWLDLIYPRLELLCDFLHGDGSIWVSIDDHEGHYMKVIMDEIFGRKNFIASMVWQKRYSRENREAIGDVHEYILVYAKNPERFKQVRNRVPLDEKSLKVYKNPNKDPRGPWRPIPMTAQGWRPNQMYPITTPTGSVHYPPEGRCWSTIEPEYQKLLKEGRIYFGKDNSSQPNIIRYLSEVVGHVPWTWLPHDEVGHTDESKKESQALFGKDVIFGTPKPERLLKRIIEIATNEGDLVLDSFLGSGTTCAVAHKMGRRYIGIEMGEHALTHCVPRMKKVIDGEQGGISKSVGWNGGGGFHFYRLGEALFDEGGLLNSKVEFANLAAHIWYSETGTSLAPSNNQSNAFLGVHDEKAYYVLYNTQNILDNKALSSIDMSHEEKIIYAEATRLSNSKLKELGITFRQIPYDVKTS